MKLPTNSRWLRRIGTGVAVALIVATTPAPALAGSAAGPEGWYGPHAGYNYKNQSVVYTNTTVAWAYTRVGNRASGNVPGGYMGYLARLYKADNGALCSQRGYAYNSGPVNSVSYPTLQTSCGGGSYYSYGVSQAWTGSAYQSYWTFRSPNQTIG